MDYDLSPLLCSQSHSPSLSSASAGKDFLYLISLSFIYLFEFNNQSDVPGGQLNFLPPSKCTWIWYTSCPPCCLSFITILYPSSKFSCFATFDAAINNFPKIASCRSSAAESPVSPSLFFGIIRMWTGAWGLISLKAKTWSSSNTTVDGIYFLIILSKIVSSCIFVRYNDINND